MTANSELPSWASELLSASARDTDEQEATFLRIVRGLEGRCDLAVARTLMKTFSEAPDFGTQEDVMSTLLSGPRSVYVTALVEELPRMLVDAPRWADSLVTTELVNYPESLVDAGASADPPTREALRQVLRRVGPRHVEKARKVLDELAD